MPVKVIIYMDYSLYFGVDYFHSPFLSDELRQSLDICVQGISNSKLVIKIRPAPPNKLPLAVRTSHYECNSNTMPMLH